MSETQKSPEEKEKHPYPKSVCFIIGNEFCERFCFYGLKTLLYLYLKNVLLYSSHKATSTEHIFIGLSYFFPLIGAILADSFLGKFRTILYLSVIYAAGCVVLSLGSLNAFGIPANTLSLLGLFLISIGTGGIKPCVSAFGGDQFKVPEQEMQLERFFSIFYFSINLGSVISTNLSPYLKENVQCFGSYTCYPLAFGVPSVLMIVATVIFVLGKPMYKTQRPERNIILDVIKCVSHAVSRKMKVGISHKSEHWLDLARDEFDEGLISDTKALLNLIPVLLPVPVFWALFDQQASRWVAQAELMNGDFGYFTFLPEQTQAINPLLVIAFIPVFEYGIYPVLSKMNLLTRPLQRLAAGGLLAAIAFAISGMVQLKIETTSAVLPSLGQAHLRVYNGIDCPLSFNSTLTGAAGLGEYGSKLFLDLNITGTLKEEVVIKPVNCGGLQVYRGNFTISEKQSKSYVIVRGPNESLEVLSRANFDQIEKQTDQRPTVRIIYKLKESAELMFLGDTREYKVTLPKESNEFLIFDLHQHKYDILVDNMILASEASIYRGGVYTLILTENGAQRHASLYETTPGNTVHMAWQLLQVTVITFSEILFSITGLQFCYQEAPASMKAVVTALWLLTTSLGNVLVSVVAELNVFDLMSYELMFFAALMIGDILIFILLAMRYKYKALNKSLGTEGKDT